MRFYFILLFLCLCVGSLQAQTPPVNETQALQQLEARGISEAEFRARMQQKGYDLDNVRPDQLPVLESVIEETIAELEAEKETATPGNEDTTGQDAESAVSEADSENEGTVPNGAVTDENIIEAVEEGATVEEAVTEELIDAESEKQPPSTVYGHNIFRDQSLEVYRSADNIKPPKTYVLGGGDQIIVAIFGRSQAEFAFEINDEGFIKPTGISRIYLKGLTLEKAERLLRQRFSQYYSFTPEQFSLTVNAARTITVNIFGEVLNDGSFTISAINTAFNALVAAGGPTEIGTVRKIKVISGGEIKTLDIYKWLFDPTVQYDFFLQNNDIIQVPVSEKIVEIKGAVKRPYRYELIEDEDLVDLIRYAGGLNVNAYFNNVQVTRIVNGQRVVIDVDLGEIIADDTGFALENGDEIQIREIPGRLENYTQIEGAVEFPGTYELEDGMRLSGLLQRGELREDARTDIAFVQRTRPDLSVQLIKVDLAEVRENPQSDADIILQRKDKLVVYSQRQFTDLYEVTIAGAVRDPNVFPFEEGLRLSDLVYSAGGLAPDATDFAYVIRNNPANNDLVEYIRVDVRNAFNDPTSEANISLEPQDRVSILSNTKFSDSYQIRVEGAVREPGSYQYDASLSVKDVLTLAGGLQLQAAANRVDIFRVILNENESTETVVATVEVDKNLNLVTGGEVNLQPFDIIVVRSVPDFELQTTVQLRGEVRYPGIYALIDDNERLTDVIKRAGGLTPEAFVEGAQLYREENNTGIVILQLEKALENPASRFNYILKDGDVIELPKSKDLVTVNLSGTLAEKLYPDLFLQEGKVSVAYVKGKNAKYYVDKYAGGVDRASRARKRFISVEYPNGEFRRSRGFLFFRGTPDVRKGAVVNIGKKPAKPPKEPKEEKEDVNILKLVTDFIALATATLTVILLAQNLNND